MKRFLVTTAVLILLTVLFSSAQYQGTANGSFVQGPGAAGAAIVGNPVQVGGTDGTNSRTIFTDANGRISITSNVAATDTETASSFTNGAATANAASTISGGLISLTQVQPYPACESSAILNAVGAATTQIIALSGSTRVRICSVIVDQLATTCTNCTWKLVSGTGTNCATGTADLTTTLGMSQASTTTGVEFAFTYPATGLRAPAGAAVCVTGAGTTPSLNTQITFSQY